MSQLVDIYNRSQKLRPVQAKLIPGQAVNFFDRQNEFQDDWKNNQVPGSPSLYTEKALGYYDTELTNMVIPQSFVRHETEIPLNQWNPKKKYYSPGAAPGETEIGTGNR